MVAKAEVFNPADVTMPMLAKVLGRNANEALVSTPEGALVLALISNALQTADQFRVSVEARQFFTDGRMDYFAHLIGLDPDFVRDAIRKVRGWPPVVPRAAGLFHAVAEGRP